MKKKYLHLTISSLFMLQCNNPLTKEPKLDRARRQIKEWESLDDEATQFAKEVNAKLRLARQQQQQQQEKQEHGADEKSKAGDTHATKDEL